MEVGLTPTATESAALVFELNWIVRVGLMLGELKEPTLQVIESVATAVTEHLVPS